MRRPRLVRPFSLAQSGGSGAADSDGVALQGLRTIEASLERQYEERTGTSISLTLPDADTHPALAPDAPLPLLPTVADSILDALCQTFVREVLVFFPFLSSTRIHQLEQRRRDMPDTLTPEQRALLYSVFAMGYLRQASSVFATDKALPVPIDPTLARLDVAYFRHAVELVQLPASPTALEALNILMLYALSTASVETTRSVLSKLCWGIHELGLHKQVSRTSHSSRRTEGSPLCLRGHRRPRGLTPPSSASLPPSSCRCGTTSTSPGSQATLPSCATSTRTSSLSQPSAAASPRQAWRSSSSSRPISCARRTRTRRGCATRRSCSRTMPSCLRSSNNTDRRRSTTPTWPTSSTRPSAQASRTHSCTTPSSP